jgi:hypothetical protein
VHQCISSCSLSPLGLAISDLRHSKLPQKFKAFCLCSSGAELIEVQEKIGTSNPYAEHMVTFSEG